jgi:hypothetical protein
MEYGYNISASKETEGKHDFKNLNAEDTDTEGY